jgi:hypothetical protein
VGLVGDDEIEESDIEVLEALHHRRVGGQVDALFPVVGGAAIDDDAGLGGQMIREGVERLLAQFFAVAEEEDALGPAGADHEVAEADGDTGLAGAGGLDEERLCGGDCRSSRRVRFTHSI